MARVGTIGTAFDLISATQAPTCLIRPNSGGEWKSFSGTYISIQPTAHPCIAAVAPSFQQLLHSRRRVVCLAIPMANQLFPSDAAQRLVWRIPAPLETAISVSANSRAPRGVSEPYCSQTLSSGSWHLIAQEPISMTPCSSITVQTPLESWPTQWEERHEHADPDDDGCEFAPDDHDGPGELLRCCGEDRPEAPEPFVVTATSKEYVTIHDYVSTAHAWLMDNFEQVSAAYNIWDDGVAPPGQKLFVLVADLQRLDVADEPTWKLLADTVQQPLPPVANPGARYGVILGLPMSAETVRALNAQLRAQGRPEVTQLL